MAVDPVCKMNVDENNPKALKSDHNGKAYYFCGPGCKQAFDRQPGQFVKS